MHGLTTRQLADLFAPWGRPAVVLPNHTPAVTPTPPADAGFEASAVAAAPVSAAASESTAPGAVAGSDRAGEAPLRSFHAFLDFPGEEHAAAAAAAVPKSGPWAAAGGRKIVVTFADLRRDKVGGLRAEGARRGRRRESVG